MTMNSPPKLYYLSDHRRIDLGRSPTAADAVAKPSPATGLIVALLLSLALWGAVWLGISSLAAQWWVR